MSGDRLLACFDVQRIVGLSAYFAGLRVDVGVAARLARCAERWLDDCLAVARSATRLRLRKRDVALGALAAALACEGGERAVCRKNFIIPVAATDVLGMVEILKWGARKRPVRFHGMVRFCWVWPASLFVIDWLRYVSIDDALTLLEHIYEGGNR